jgi:hypothetical protein
LIPARQRDTKAAANGCIEEVDRDCIVDHAPQSGWCHRPAVGASIFVEPSQPGTLRTGPKPYRLRKFPAAISACNFWFSRTVPPPWETATPQQPCKINYLRADQAATETEHAPPEAQQMPGCCGPSAGCCGSCCGLEGQNAQGFQSCCGCCGFGGDWGAGDLDASSRLRQIRAVLGGWACTLLEAALVQDLSWAALGRKYRCDPKTARAWVIAAIKALRTI